MNQYFSVTRTFRAESIFEGVLDLGTGRIVVTGNSSRLFTIPVGTISPESRLIIRRLGVFCNFADGLVFEYPWDAFNIRLETVIVAPTSTAIAYTCLGGGNFPQGDFSAITAGQTLKIGNQYFRARAPGTVVEVTTYPYPPASAGFATLMTSNYLGDFTNLLAVKNLNEMFEFNEYLNPGGNQALAGATDVNISAILTLAPSLLTSSIDTAFDTEGVYFDVVADIEYTPQVI